MENLKIIHVCLLEKSLQISGYLLPISTNELRWQVQNRKYCPLKDEAFVKKIMQLWINTFHIIEINLFSISENKYRLIRFFFYKFLCKLNASFLWQSYVGLNSWNGNWYSLHTNSTLMYTWYYSYIQLLFSKINNCSFHFNFANIYLIYIC